MTIPCLSHCTFVGDESNPFIFYELVFGFLEKSPEYGHSSKRRFRTPRLLIGRATFSSAQMNAQQFRDRTKAILVGEPTGQKPNHFGEIKNFISGGTITTASPWANFQH